LFSERVSDAFTVANEVLIKSFATALTSKNFLGLVIEYP